jgi:hypothetical protein
MTVNNLPNASSLQTTDIVPLSQLNSSTPALNGMTLAQLITFLASSFLNLVGITNGSNASAGNVGEEVQSLVAVGSAVSLTTATPANVANISLTAGDWDVEAQASFTASSATQTAAEAGISATSATLPTDGSEVYTGLQTTTTTDKNTVTMARKRVNITVTTAIYLVAQATFSAGSIGAFGAITARRVR